MRCTHKGELRKKNAREWSSCACNRSVTQDRLTESCRSDLVADGQHDPLKELLSYREPLFAYIFSLKLFYFLSVVRVHFMLNVQFNRAQLIPSYIIADDEIKIVGIK